MDWATAAAVVADRTPDLSDAPDPPGDDYEFWLQVEKLVNGNALEEAKSVYHWLSQLHPRDREGKWIQKLDAIASEAHRDQVDKSGRPYIEHVRAVADSVPEHARGVAYMHDALEDTHMTEGHLQALTDERGKPLLRPEEIAAVRLLSRDHSDTAPGAYDRYIEQIASARDEAGELARTVKVADLQHNLGRMGNLPAQQQARLRPRYERALARLTPERAALEQRGTVFNRPELDEREVEARLREMYEAAVEGGHSETDRHWYADQHAYIGRVAEKLGVNPQTMAAIVSATSPQNRWIWENTGKMPNMEAAVAAVLMAKRNPDEPAELLAKRLVAQAKGWEEQTEAAKQAGEKLIGPAPEGPGMLGNSLENAIRLYRGEDPEKVLNAPKTRSFYNNLAWPDQELTTTIDTLMARALQGETSRAEYKKAAEIVLGKGSGPSSGYRWAVQRTENLRRALADEGVHLMPQELQAIIWREQQRRQDAAEAVEKARKKAEREAARAEKKAKRT
jgi:hypothetical protein